MALLLNSFLLLWGFAFGTVIGSFLNVVVLRLHSGETLTGRSHCPFCKHTLSTLDLVPIFSFLFLRGKCRYCRKELSWQYPLVEITTAIAFSLVFVSFASVFEAGNLVAFLPLVFALYFTAVLISISVFDLKWGIIPDQIILPAALVAFLYQILLFLFGLTSWHTLLFTLISCFALVSFFLALIVFTKGRGMGGGDLKLVLFLSLSMGWENSLVGIFLAFLTGAFVAVMLLLRGRKKLKQTIPFGPFLAFGAFIGLLFGDKLFSLYLKTLGF